MQWIRFLVVACGLLLFFSPVVADAETVPQLPPKVGLEEHLGEQVPLDLVFTDELGRELQLGDLVNRPTLLAPVYFRCSNVCNALQGGLAQALPGLSADLADHVQVISFSFDPGETPAQARGSKNIYRAAMKGGFPIDNWAFLTGSQESIDRLTDAIGYRYFQEGVEFVHPVAVAILSADGKITRYLEGTRFLSSDLSLALLEASDGRLGNTITRLASYCYSYDPEQRGYVFNILRVAAVIIFVSLLTLFLVLMLGGRRKRKV
jgi:protein SCO1/2